MSFFKSDISYISIAYIFFSVFITLLIPIISGYTCTPGTGEILLRSSALNSAEKRVENDITSNSNNEDGNGKHLIKQGIFTSPKWPKSYESGTRCVYRFIADVGEKVHIKFDHFVLSGDMPRLVHQLLLIL